MSRINAVTDLLDPLHPLLVVDLDVWLSTGDAETASVSSVVNRMVLLLIVKLDVLD